MAIPTKNRQIQALMEFLPREENEDRTLEEIATQIVEGYHALMLKGLKSPASPARLGMLFKTPLDAKVRRFVWEGGGQAWIVSETDSYGWLGNPAILLDWCEEFRPKKYREIDGKRKLVEMTDEEIEEEWTNPDFKVGDVFTQHQRQYSYEVIATSPQSVLLRGGDGRLTVDSASNLKKYYKREIKGVTDGW